MTECEWWNVIWVAKRFEICKAVANIKLRNIVYKVLNNLLMHSIIYVYVPIFTSDVNIPNYKIVLFPLVFLSPSTSLILSVPLQVCNCWSCSSQPHQPAICFVCSCSFLSPVFTHPNLSRQVATDPEPGCAGRFLPNKPGVCPLLLKLGFVGLFINLL